MSKLEPVGGPSLRLMKPGRTHARGGQAPKRDLARSGTLN